MRLNSPVLLLAAAALLAESQPAGQGQPIEVRTSNASVEITGYDGDRLQTVEDAGDGGALKFLAPRKSTIEVSTSNGSIHVSGITGKLTLTTSNGAITVQDAGEAEIHAHSSNGVIKIEVSAELNANLHARTSNGRIHSDVEVATDRIGANFLEGKIGSGGPEIDLQTSNGVIHVLRATRQERVNSTFKPGEVK